MGRIDQYARYLAEKTELFKKFDDLEKKHNTSIISKLKSRRYDFDSFQGMLVELEFGLFLDEFCDRLEFSPNINGQTPDWLVTVNGKQIIIEIARLKDTAEVERLTREDEAANRIGFHRLGSRPERILGNVISPKIDKYKNLITSTGFPFILGIYNTPVSEVHLSDAAQLFYGKSIESYFSGRIKIDRSETIFHSNKYLEIRSLLNGVLWLDQPPFNPFTNVRQPNKFNYWGNDNAMNQLSEIGALTAIAGGFD